MREIENRRKYRNTLNQPLPIMLNSDSLSVPAKGYFYVDEPDFDSAELKRLCIIGNVRLIETVVKVEQDGWRKSSDSLLMDLSDEQGLVPDGHQVSVDEKPGEDKLLDKTDDSLTSPSEMMESSNDGDVSYDAGAVKDGTPKKKKKKKAWVKELKAASRDKPRS